jgi:hypothetical protein
MLREMIQTFANIGVGEFVPILTIIAGMLVGFYGIAKIMLKQASADRIADRKERAEFVKAIKDMATSNREIAKYTRQGNEEAKQRNGHLAELTIQSKNETIEILHNIKSQHVENQIVHNETVENKKRSKK